MWEKISQVESTDPRRAELPEKIKPELDFCKVITPASNDHISVFLLISGDQEVELINKKDLILFSHLENKSRRYFDLLGEYGKQDI